MKLNKKIVIHNKDNNDNQDKPKSPIKKRYQKLLSETKCLSLSRSKLNTINSNDNGDANLNNFNDANSLSPTKSK